MLSNLTKLFSFDWNDPVDGNNNDSKSNTVDISHDEAKKQSKRQEEESGGSVKSNKKLRSEVLYNRDFIEQNEICMDSIETSVIDQISLGAADIMKQREEKEIIISRLEEDLTSLQKSIASPIICTICKKLPRAIPLKSCTAHHKFCQGCSSRLTLCTKCSKPLYEEDSFPLLKAVLSLVNRNCLWSDMGCNYKSRLEQLLKHEDICKYQAVLCWGCGTKTPLNSFDKHDPDLDCFSFNTIHSSPITKTMLVEVDKSNKEDVEWNPLAVKYAGKVLTRGVWTFHTAAQLLPSSCSKYISTITVSCPGREATGWTFTVSIPPISLVEVEVEDVLRTGKCLVMTEAAMQGVMTVSHDNKGTLFNVSVQIADTDL